MPGWLQPGVLPNPGNENSVGPGNFLDAIHKLQPGMQAAQATKKQSMTDNMDLSQLATGWLSDMNNSATPMNSVTLPGQNPLATNTPSLK